MLYDFKIKYTAPTPTIFFFVVVVFWKATRPEKKNLLLLVETISKILSGKRISSMTEKYL